MDKLVKIGQTKVRLMLPQNGGPFFVVAVKSDQPLFPVRQADINAAVNIALRAIAGPSCYHACPRVRLIKGKTGDSKGKWVVRRENKRERAQFDIPGEVVFQDLMEDSDVLKGNNTNLFHDPLNISAFGFATIKGQRHPQLVHGSALLSRQKGISGHYNGAVARLEWEVCHRINIERLKKLGQDATMLSSVMTPPENSGESGEEDIPM